MTTSVRQHRTLRLALVSAAILLCPVVQAETFTGTARVIDADTLAIAGERVRLDAIDAPESRQFCTRHPWACGNSATQAMRNLVGRNPVRCEVSRRDRYGRAIRFVAGRDLQRQLVRQGLALAWQRYFTRYAPEEKAGREERIGLWSGSFVKPWRRRAERHAIRRAPSKSVSCRIKGNISEHGHIYHVPGGEHYARIRIDKSRGERWFCSEARGGGWHRSRQ